MSSIPDEHAEASSSAVAAPLPEKTMVQSLEAHPPPLTTSAEATNTPPTFQPGTRFYLAFSVLAVLTLMVALDGTTISVALPIIAQQLNGSAIEAFWAGTAFLLCSTVFQPIFASFSDIFGRVPLIMTAITFFLVGVVVAMVAHDFTLLLIGRSLQGVGGGGIVAMTEIVVTDLIPLRFRRAWTGAIASMYALGSVSGPIIGGAFAVVNWRWILYINLPFIGVAYVLVPLFLRLKFVTSSLTSKLRRIDWFGSVLFVSSMTSILVPLSWGGVMFDWTSWHTLVPLIIGAVGTAGLFVYERYGTNEPLIRLSIFANRSTNIAYFNTVIQGMILWVILYFEPLYFEAVLGYRPLIAGVALFPATFTVAPMATITGLLITKTNSYRWSIWGGWAATVLGCGLLVLLDVDTQVVQWIFICLPSGIGLGVLSPALQFQVQASQTDQASIAFSIAMYGFFRSVGQTFGVAIGGVIFQNQMITHLRAYLQFAALAAQLGKDAAALVQIIQQTPAGADRLALRAAYADSLKVV
ncbi:hypothetical protein MMC34_007150 [Xylographa carneopallida]|nr:hypothetical protein [Xylographa carneopallida]